MTRSFRGSCAGGGAAQADLDRAATLPTAARYLGLPGKAAATPDMAALLNKAYDEMLRTAIPNSRLVPCALTLSPQGHTLRLGDLPPVESRSLHQLLAGCTRGYALLATLGMGLDLALRRLMVTDPALGTALGACGSAYIDVYIDKVLAGLEDTLQQQEAGPLYLTQRFSPGYGDAPLSMQPALLRLCGAQALGVRLTQGNLMLPEKSVSALLGLTTDPARAWRRASGCTACGQKNCTYREERT